MYGAQTVVVLSLCIYLPIQISKNNRNIKDKMKSYIYNYIYILRDSLGVRVWFSRSVGRRFDSHPRQRQRIRTRCSANERVMRSNDAQPDVSVIQRPSHSTVNSNTSCKSLLVHGTSAAWRPRGDNLRSIVIRPVW